MPTYKLLVRDSDNVILDWNRGGSIGMPDDGQSVYNGVSLAEDPEVGGAYDGTTYTPPVAPDYFVIKDGATVLGDGEEVSLVGDDVATKVLTVQKRDGGTDADKAGANETIKVLPQAMIFVDKLQITLDDTDGAEDVTLGPFPSGQKGCVAITFRDDAGALASRSITLEVT